MIDFSKFGFTIVEMDGKKCDDEDGTHYENELLEIQHWKKPNIYIVAFRRDRLIEWKDDYDFLDEQRGWKKFPHGAYKLKSGISESETKMAMILMNGNFYVYPLFVGEIKDETFFEILINAVCTDAEKLIQCSS